MFFSLRARYFMTLLLSAALLSGCSISHSVSSSSDSSRSISRSSTSSSGPEVSDETKKAYVKDVETYVAAIGRSDIGPEEFMRGIGSIAKRHAITDWESYDFTYTAIGKGLKKARLSKDEIDTLPYLKPLVAGDAKRLGLIKKGY